jgi:hypothetical protein
MSNDYVFFYSDYLSETSVTELMFRGSVATLHRRVGANSRTAMNSVFSVFDSDDCRLFARALGHAWEMFLQARGLRGDNIDTAKGALTYAIFHEAQNGERNARRLAIAAVARMSRFEPMVRRQRMWRQPDLPRAASF